MVGVAGHRGPRRAKGSATAGDLKPVRPAASSIPPGRVDPTVGAGHEQVEMVGIAREHRDRGAQGCSPPRYVEPAVPAHDFLSLADDKGAARKGSDLCAT